MQLILLLDEKINIRCKYKYIRDQYMYFNTQKCVPDK
jgi:hypothetical protein